MGAFDDKEQPLWSVGSNVPANVAVVGFLSDGELAWQRPIDGLVYLPAAGYGSAAIRLYDADGHEVTTGTNDGAVDASPIVALPRQIPDGEERLSGVFETTIRTCLTENGANPATGDYPDDADPKMIWEDCLAVGSAAWQAKAHELGLD